MVAKTSYRCARVPGRCAADGTPVTEANERANLRRLVENAEAVWSQETG